MPLRVSWHGLTTGSRVFGLPCLPLPSCPHAGCIMSVKTMYRQKESCPHLQSFGVFCHCLLQLTDLESRVTLFFQAVYVFDPPA